MMTDKEAHAFYTSSQWYHKRDEILAMDHYECVICRSRGRYTPAVLVHHVNHLKDRPDLALSTYYFDENGNRHRQLVSVCRACHETVCHPDRIKKKKKKKPLTPERW